MSKNWTFYETVPRRTLEAAPSAFYLISAFFPGPIFRLSFRSGNLQSKKSFSILKFLVEKYFLKKKNGLVGLNGLFSSGIRSKQKKGKHTRPPQSNAFVKNFKSFHKGKFRHVLIRILDILMFSF